MMTKGKGDSVNKQEEQRLRESLGMVALKVLGIRKSDIKAMTPEELQALRQQTVDALNDIRRKLEPLDSSDESQN